MGITDLLAHTLHTRIESPVYFKAFKSVGSFSDIGGIVLYGTVRVVLIGIYLDDIGSGALGSGPCECHGFPVRCPRQVGRGQTAVQHQLRLYLRYPGASGGHPESAAEGGENKYFCGYVFHRSLVLFNNRIVLLSGTDVRRQRPGQGPVINSRSHS